MVESRRYGLESIRWNRDSEETYYRYLKAGYKLPLVGGTDKMSNEVPVGLYRTYARLDGEFTYEAWCSAVRAGRTFCGLSCRTGSGSPPSELYWERQLRSA